MKYIYVAENGVSEHTGHKSVVLLDLLVSHWHRQSRVDVEAPCFVFNHTARLNYSDLPLVRSGHYDSFLWTI